MKNTDTTNLPSASQSKGQEPDSFWGVGLGGGVGGVVLMAIVYIIYKLILRFRSTDVNSPTEVNPPTEANARGHLDEQRLIEILESHIRPLYHNNREEMSPQNALFLTSKLQSQNLVAYKKGKSHSDELQTSYSDEENAEDHHGHPIRTKKIDTLKTIRKYKKC
jgi:hypothetical protein